MTIGAYGTGAAAVRSAGESFGRLKADLAGVQGQLATGKVATSHAGLGAGAAASLGLRARMATLDNYRANGDDASLRLGLMDAGLTQIGRLVDGLPTSLSGASGQIAVGATNAAVSAQHGVELIVDILNTELNGRYLFSGRSADTEPVVSADLILNGDADRAGLKTLSAQRKAADAGPDGMGRLALSASGTSVSLAEAAAGLPFGLKIFGASATGAGVTASVAAGPPPAAAIAVGAQPAEGDAIAVVLGLPDGTRQTIRLVAGAALPGSGDVAYAAGATPAATAANIRAALAGAVTALVGTTLPSASAMKAATDFFAGNAASPPLRVAGPPYDTATSLVPGTAANTVVWYRGDVSASPRETAPVRVADGRTVGIGAAADEPAFRSVLASFAALASESFAASDTTAQARYAALADRISTTLGGAGGGQAVADVAADLSLAGATVKSAATAGAIAKNQLSDSLAHIEDADPNEAAMKLLATQTRLQASYQTSSAILKLSLVDFL